MAMVYMDSATRAFKWNVGHVFPQQISCPDRNQKCHTAAGIFLIRYVMLPGDARKVIPAPFCVHQLNFQNFDQTVRFLYQTLQNLPLLGSCKNLAKCARILATDLAGQFHFSPKFFKWGTEKYTLVLELNLIVELEPGKASSENHTCKPETVDQIEHYLTKECPEIHVNGSRWIEEVKPFFEIIDDDDQDKQNEATCPICLRELYEDCENDDVARVRDCSHMFHAKCIGRWLRDGHSCPMCRCDANVSVQRKIQPRTFR